MKRFSLFFFFVFLTVFLKAQITQTEQVDTTLIDFKADILEASAEIGVGIQRLTGNVVMSHANATMTCDTAFFNREENSFLGSGNVFLNQGDTINIWSKKLFYDGRIKIGKFRNDVIMKKDSMTLSTDSLDFDLNSDIGYYKYGAKSGNGSDTLISKIGIFDSSKDEFYFRTGVVIRSPNQVINSDTLNYNTKTNVSTFLGPSEILGDSNYIYCENGWYNHKKEVAQFNKNAYLNNGSNTLKGDSLFYDRKNGYGESFKNVTLIDTTQKMVISGRFGKYIEATEYSFVSDSALLKHIIDSDTLYLHADTLISFADTAYFRSDSTHILVKSTIVEKDSIIKIQIPPINLNDTLFVTRDSLVHFVDTLITKRDTLITTLDSTVNYKHIRAYHKVKLFKSDFQAKADSLCYTTLDSTFRIYTNPVLWADSLQVTADSIFIFTKNNEIEHMQIMSKSFLIMQQPENRYNQVKGVNIWAYFKEDELFKLDVKTDAKSIFYVKDKGEIVGLNKTESADMQILRKNGEIEFVKWFKQITGGMYPENKIEGSQKVFEDFKWRESEKPKTWKDIFIWEEVVNNELNTIDESDKKASKKESGTKLK